MEKEICKGEGEEERDKSNCTLFLCDIPQPFSWAHPSWMTIASWFAYQKTLSDMCLPSSCKRLENIDNYWQNPKALATFHVEYCIYQFILLFAPFFLLMRARYWVEYLIASLRQLGRCATLAYYGSGCCFGLEVGLLLLVRVHFQMTQTLIKIIITVAPRLALQWGLCRLRPGPSKASVISYSSYRQAERLQW